MKTTSVLHILSDTNTRDVISLASKFGMGLGVSKSLWSSSDIPKTLCL